MERYGVDIIVGNLLGNKNWVSINFNKTIYGHTETHEHK